MSKAKPAESFLAIFQKIVNKHKPKAASVTALILTTSTGDKIEFEKLGETDTPKEGDAAKIDGKPATGEIIVIVDEEEVLFTFDESGVIIPNTEEEGDGEEMEALKAENTSLKAENEQLRQSFTAMETETKELIRNMVSEETPEPKKKGFKEGEKVTSMSERVAALKAKKEAAAAKA